MRAVSLLVVFLVAKLAVLAGRPLQPSGWTPIVYFWQDGLVALGFALLDRAIKRPRASWAIYFAAISYVAINVAVERVLSSPLTWPMIRAASGTLSDSVKHHASPTNLALVLLVLSAGLSVPIVLRRFTPSLRAVVPPVVLIIGIGPFVRSRVETNGLDRNPLLALITTAIPRLGANDSGEVRRSSWRQSPFEQAPGGADISRLHGAAKGRNVVMVLLESTAARYLSMYGSPVDPMPNLSVIGRSALVFENAYAVYPESIKGLFSVLCSRYPAMDISQESYKYIATPALPWILKSAGYHTALFHSGRFMYLGMEAVVQNRGFDVLEDAGEISGNIKSSFGVDEASTIRRALAWVDSLPGNEPFFLTYLPIAGHHPYDTPEAGPFAGHREQDRYLNALHYADSSLGSLREALSQRGIEQNTLFIIFGDHGEAFGQHTGNFAHSQFIYEENVHVPFLISMPGMIDHQIRVGRPLSLIDTAPTILDLVGLPASGAYQGLSALDNRPAMALFYTDYSLGLLGLRDGPWKYIYEIESSRSRLFNLDADQDETVDVSSRLPDRVSAYHEHLLSWSENQKAIIQREASKHSIPQP